MQSYSNMLGYFVLQEVWHLFQNNNLLTGADVPLMVDQLNRIAAMHMSNHTSEALDAAGCIPLLLHTTVAVSTLSP